MSADVVYHRPPTEGMTTLSLRARARLREAEHARRAEHVLPPPSVPATPCTGDEPWFPSKVKAWLRLAERSGWRARATRAVGPRIGAGAKILEEDCRTLAVALQGPAGDRIVVVYQWNNSKGEWESQEVQDMRTGAIIGANDAKARIRG